MFVYIPSNGQGPQLFSADDLSALSVRAAAGSAHLVTISPILQSAGAGEVADGYVWLDISWLLAAAGQPTRNGATNSIDMLEYAAANIG